jgi:hypothetical protein
VNFYVYYFFKSTLPSEAYMKWIIGLLALGMMELYAQDVRLDKNTATATLAKVSQDRDAKLQQEHAARLAELEKTGVQVIKSDVTLTVTVATKIAFGWVVAAGQGSDRMRTARSPHVITLSPAKDGAGKDVAQKWEISYTTGNVRAIAQ